MSVLFSLTRTVLTVIGFEATFAPELADTPHVATSPGQWRARNSPFQESGESTPIAPAHNPIPNGHVNAPPSPPEEPDEETAIGATIKGRGRLTSIIFGPPSKTTSTVSTEGPKHSRTASLAGHVRSLSRSVERTSIDTSRSAKPRSHRSQSTSHGEHQPNHNGHTKLSPPPPELPTATVETPSMHSAKENGSVVSFRIDAPSPSKTTASLTTTDDHISRIRTTDGDSVASTKTGSSAFSGSSNGFVERGVGSVKRRWSKFGIGRKASGKELGSSGSGGGSLSPSSVRAWGGADLGGRVVEEEE